MGVLTEYFYYKTILSKLMLCAEISERENPSVESFPLSASPDSLCAEVRPYMRFNVALSISPVLEASFHRVELFR